MSQSARDGGSFFFFFPPTFRCYRWISQKWKPFKAVKSFRGREEATVNPSASSTASPVSPHACPEWLLAPAPEQTSKNQTLRREFIIFFMQHERRGVGVNKQRPIGKVHATPTITYKKEICLGFKPAKQGMPNLH